MSAPGWGEFQAIASGLYWAVGVIFFRRAGQSIPPLALNQFKNFVALACFVPVLLLSGAPLFADRPVSDQLRIVVSGVLGIAVADTLFFMALNRLGAGLSAVVDCFYAPSMITLGVIFLGEHFTLGRVLGAVFVLAAILTGSRSRPVAGATRRDIVIGVILGMTGMVIIATSVVVVKPLFTTGNVIEITTARLLVGTIALFPVLLFRRERQVFVTLLAPSRLWVFAVPGAVFGGALAMWAWIDGLSHLSMAEASILNQLSTIWIFLLAAMFLGEPMTRRRVVAVVLAFLGAALLRLT